MFRFKVAAIVAVVAAAAAAIDVVVAIVRSTSKRSYVHAHSLSYVLVRCFHCVCLLRRNFLHKFCLK